MGDLDTLAEVRAAAGRRGTAGRGGPEAAGSGGGGASSSHPRPLTCTASPHVCAFVRLPPPSRGARRRAVPPAAAARALRARLESHMRRSRGECGFCGRRIAARGLWCPPNAAVVQHMRPQTESCMGYGTCSVAQRCGCTLVPPPPRLASQFAMLSCQRHTMPCSACLPVRTCVVFQWAIRAVRVAMHAHAGA
eukprot:245201-Chlamydomonas_euryale.AAC.9